MQFTEQPNEHQFFLRQADATSVTVVDRRIRRSFVVSASEVIEDLPARNVHELDSPAIEAILRLHPEVVLLGTGERAVFPPQSVLAQFLQRGIGLETMGNAAAARTFNVLVGEGRQAVAAFLLPGET